MARSGRQGLSVCGIFAYHGTGAPDPDLLAAAASEAARRGPHGHGWVTRAAGGELSEHRQPGALNGDLALLHGAAGTVLGHARLATSGSWSDPAHLQPVVTGGHAIAHNGNVYNAGELAAGAPTDTHALAAAYAELRAAGTPPETALAGVISRARQQAWAVAVLDAGGTLLAHRHYHPLYILRAGGGAYVSSRPFHPACELLGAGEPVIIAEGA